MKPKEFFDLVVQMRAAQRKFFTTPSSQILAKDQAKQDAIAIERQVDAEIKRVQQVLELKQQPTFQFQ